MAALKGQGADVVSQTSAGKYEEQQLTLECKELSWNVLIENARDAWAKSFPSDEGVCGVWFGVGGFVFVLHVV